VELQLFGCDGPRSRVFVAVVEAVGACAEGAHPPAVLPVEALHPDVGQLHVFRLRPDEASLRSSDVFLTELRLAH